MGIFCRKPKDSFRRYDHPKAGLLEEESAVPKGFLAVYVGEHMRRFVIPMNYLSLPAFKELMEAAAEMFGYDHEGGLRIPCGEEAFEEMLKVVEGMRKRRKKEKKKEKKDKKKKEKSFSLKIC